MITKIESWTIKDLIKYKGNINPNPQYQRTSVWSLTKKKLLIDSILRGYDIPKFYISETPNDPHYQYEVTDGQQRMRAIWEFTSDNENEKYSLNKALINGINTQGLQYSDLQKEENKNLLKQFLNYEIHISIIKQANAEEKRSLFARLQMGERLKPVELRHALSSNIGTAIFSLTETHSFFDDGCKIPNTRFKHQDYLDHVITLVYFKGEKNIKAAEMRQLYEKLADVTLNEFQDYLRKTNDVLNIMRRINSYNKGMFKNKWAFVDVFYVIYNNLERIDDIKPKNFAENFAKFEKKRKKYARNPEYLIEDKASLEYDKDLYDYILAFKAGGAEKQNVKIRHRVFTSYFLNDSNIIFKTR